MEAYVQTVFTQQRSIGFALHHLIDHRYLVILIVDPPIVFQRSCPVRCREMKVFDV